MSDPLNLSLRQLEHLLAVVDCNLSVSNAAIRLGVAQSAVSRSIIMIERNCGKKLFLRRGRRFIGQTDFCQVLVSAARDVTSRMSNLRSRAARAVTGDITGDLRIGATHLQMRYFMPAIMRQMKEQLPGINLKISQAIPYNLVDQVLARTIDACVCSEEVVQQQGLSTVHMYSWNRLLIGTGNEKILKVRQPTIEQLAEVPLVTYIPGITGRFMLDAAFARQRLTPNVVIAAADSDVIKEFVRRGLGVGVIASVAYDPKADADLQARSVGHLFSEMKTRIAYRSDFQMNPALEKFIEFFRSATQSLPKIAGKAGK
ncbi:MAG: LysR substrate-binding domain-containing protein [Betaproteobacteria bacterium]|nr:LysR substrate-binding domain-containing protein [Betaproteobacteria bacterium]